MNRSPWLAHVERRRDEQPLRGDARAETVIIGAGISGVVTAYFLLRDTQQQITILEAGRVAHGATGHNAGQVVADFERSFPDIAEEFGWEMAAQAQRDLDSVWGLLEEIFSVTQLPVPFFRCTGYLGFSTLEHALQHLEQQRLLTKAGVRTRSLYLSQTAPWIHHIPEHYRAHYALVSHQELLQLLETPDTRYVGAEGRPLGCLNSAAFTEALLTWLLQHYPERLRVHEQSPVQHIALQPDGAHVQGALFSLEAQRVILCTNGFEGFTLADARVGDINTRYHEHVYGTIGYMEGYLQPLSAPAAGFAYLEPHHAQHTDPYMYVTRRPFTLDGVGYQLYCVGGPEERLPDKKLYSSGAAHPAKAHQAISQFMAHTYGWNDEARHATAFRWHGLMGYTKNGIRMVGFEPCNERLLYNLGCNGIGIIPSIFGGKRIAQLLRGDQLPPSIFDPFHATCSPRAAQQKTPE